MNELEIRIMNVLPRGIFVSGGGAKLSSVAECANCSKSQAWRILTKFHELGYVGRIDEPYRKLFVSRWHPTVRGLLAASRAKRENEDAVPF